MNPIDYVILAVILAILCGSSWYIRKAKKSGKKCIGCPDGASCSGKCGGCNGNCGSCGNHQ